MKKRLVFKNWVSYLLVVISIIAFMLLGSDCEDMELFIKLHLYAISVFTISLKLLSKYARKDLFN